jgi:cytoskeleton protein RodZ
MAMFGDTLRQARAHKGVTLKEAEQATRINRHHLAALEDENFSALPPPIYQRGIVRNYAVYLELDPARLLARFEEAQGDAAPVTNDPVTAMRPLDMPSHWAPNFAIIAFAVVLSAIVFAWVYSAYVAPGDASPTATQIVATVTPFANDVALPTEPPPTKAPATKAPKATTPPQATTPPPVTTPPATQPTDRTALSDTTQPRRTQPTPTPTARAETTQASSGVIEQGGDNQKGQPADTSNAGSTDQSNTQTTQDQAQTQQPQQGQSGQYVTGITITASADIYVEVTADGVSVYAGNLPSGQSTQQFVGSNFNVYTTSGQNTVFTNSCGATFQMGYETGEANYVLSANAESCNPNQ